MYKVPLIPAGFQPPTALETERFRLRPLDYEVMLADYEAVIKGARNLARAYERDEAYYRNFTLQDEIIELGWHIGEWRRRRSFAYAIMRPDGGTCYGSVYVYPTMKRDYDSQVIMWTVPEAPPGLEGAVYEAVRRWMLEDWRFAKVGYPGREMSFADWHALTDQ